MKRNCRGITIIEIIGFLAVVAILAILIAPEILGRLAKYNSRHQITNSVSVVTNLSVAPK